MPLSDRLATPGEHFLPVLDLGWSTLAAKDDLTYEFVASHPVMVHDGNDEARLADALVGKAEKELFIEDGIQGSFHRRRLPLFHLLSVV